jgi:hypothetical protein
MTWFQIYALFISPLVLLAAGLLVAFIAVRGDRRKHLPGE